MRAILHIGPIRQRACWAMMHYKGLLSAVGNDISWKSKDWPTSASEQPSCRPDEVKHKAAMSKVIYSRRYTYQQSTDFCPQFATQGYSCIANLLTLPQHTLEASHKSLWLAEDMQAHSKRARWTHQRTYEVQ